MIQYQKSDKEPFKKILMDVKIILKIHSKQE